MPNWVYNSIKVYGDDAAEVKRFKETLAKPYSYDGETSDRVFSFMNVIAPPQESIDSGEYWGTHGFVNGEQVGRTSNNWYEFNNREWGTKWDACEDELDQESGNYLEYHFSTAWAPPEPVFRALTEQYPTLEFEIHCVEEQGWGMEYHGHGGSLAMTDEWDIPDNHEDSMKRTGSCQCEWADPTDPSEWGYLYDDCPSKNLDTAQAIEQLEKIEEKLSQ